MVGEHANDYAKIAAKDKLTELQLRMRQLLDQIDQITKEQAYQRVSCCFYFTLTNTIISYSHVGFSNFIFLRNNIIKIKISNFTICGNLKAFR